MEEDKKKICEKRGYHITNKFNALWRNNKCETCGEPQNEKLDTPEGR